MQLYFKRTLVWPGYITHKFDEKCIYPELQSKIGKNGSTSPRLTLNYTFETYLVMILGPYLKNYSFYWQKTKGKNTKVQLSQYQNLTQKGSLKTYFLLQFSIFSYGNFRAASIRHFSVNYSPDF